MGRARRARDPRRRRRASRRRSSTVSSSLTRSPRSTTATRSRPRTRSRRGPRSPRLCCRSCSWSADRLMHDPLDHEGVLSLVDASAHGRVRCRCRTGSRLWCGTTSSRRRVTCGPRSKSTASTMTRSSSRPRRCALLFVISYDHCPRRAGGVPLAGVFTDATAARSGHRELGPSKPPPVFGPLLLGGIVAVGRRGLPRPTTSRRSSR